MLNESDSTELAIDERSPLEGNCSHSLKNFWNKFALVLLVALIALLLAYQETVRGMVLTWMEHQSHNHGFLIVPVVMYFIFQKRQQIYTLHPQPNIAGLFLLGGLSLLWAMAYLLSVQIIQDFTVVSLVIVLIGTLVGWEVFRLLLFPLGLLYFAVPFGGEFIPLLQDLTASVTVNVLHFLGVPAYLEGRFFFVPGGSWEVLAACAGLQYIAPSIALGYVFAGTVFHQWLPQVIFMVVAVIMPVLANLVRVIFIVLLALASDYHLAIGADHLMYGWIVFGLMEFLLFYVGLRWQERRPQNNSESFPRKSELYGKLSFQTDVIASDSVYLRRTVIVAAIAVIVATVPPVFLEHFLDFKAIERVSPQFPTTSGEWTRAAYAGAWTPQLKGTVGTLSGSFSSNEGTVHLYMAYYGKQQQGQELINFNNNLIEPSEGRLIVEGEAVAVIQGESLSVTESQVVTKENRQRYLIWNWYSIDGHVTANRYYAKLLEGWSRLWGKSEAAAIVLITSLDDDGGITRRRLQRFLDATGQWDDAIRQAFLQ